MAGLSDFDEQTRLRDQSNTERILTEQRWQLGTKNGIAPILYLDVEGKSLLSVTDLVNSLKEEQINFSERIRTSNRSKVLEVIGDSFVKLAKIIDVDRVNQMHADLDAPHIQAVDWKFGLKGGTVPTLYVDLSETFPELSGPLIQALRSRDITSNQRGNSKGHLVLEVYGDDLLKLNDIVKHPEMSRSFTFEPQAPSN